MRKRGESQTIKTRRSGRNTETERKRWTGHAQSTEGMLITKSEASPTIQLREKYITKKSKEIDS